jgi:DNA polymerase-1
MLMLVDGNNAAYRAFHTAQGNLRTKGGEASGVILGFLNILKKLLEKFPETHTVVVVWDGGKAKWRKELYPDYKANRSYGQTEEEKLKFEELYKQIDTLHEFLPNLNVHSIKVKGQEADDIISLISKDMDANGKCPVTIVTSDKDMYQLISENTSVYSPYKDKVISLLSFYEELGVTKEAYIGFRALVGDTSDNIVGVPGIGEVTAKNLMNKYGHIDNILGATGENKKALLKSKRTEKIFEKANLNTLGINNKIMNFDYVPFDQEVHNAIERVLVEPSELYVNSKEVRAFFTRWQFLENLTNFVTWIVPFHGLGDDY